LPWDAWMFAGQERQAGKNEAITSACRNSTKTTWRCLDGSAEMGELRSSIVAIKEVLTLLRLACVLTLLGSLAHWKCRSAYYRASRPLVMRRVTMTPSALQSHEIEPPSWTVMARLRSLLPYPPSPAGEATVGPPRSVQTTTTSVSWAGQAISNVPVGDDRAPYFSELVASSWTTSASVVAACSPTPMRGTETRTRPLNAPMSS
jgi:hypothetical protein